MRILAVSSEMVPYAKTGGLADVVGALPRYLAALGNDVRVFLPLYDTIHRDKLSLTSVIGRLDVRIEPQPLAVGIECFVHVPGCLKKRCSSSRGRLIPT